MQRIEACCLASHIGATAQTGALQCVCDLNTRTILQCSGMLKTARGPQNPVGLTCWQAFAPGSEGPCFGCPVSELAGAAGKSVEREQPDPDTGRHYLRTDSLIPLEDGRSLHLIHSLDITDVSETRRQLQHDMLLIDLLTNLSLTFASSDSFDQKVNRALSTTGRFLGVDRTYILKDYPEKCHYLRSNIWLNPDVPQNDDLDAGKFDYIVRYDGNNADYVSLASQVPVCFADLAGLPASMRSRWEGYDIISLMAIPLHADGRYWGVLSFDMCTGPRRWSDSDLRLGQAVGGILSAAIEHNRVEAGLHTVRTTLDAVLNAVPDMIYWMDDQYTILGCNRRYADHLARLPKDIAGKTDFDLYPTAAAQALRREDALVFETREPFFSEERSVPTRDGRTLWLTAGKFPVFDAAGKAVLLLCVLRDVSELKKRKESELEHLHRDEGLQSVIRTVESAGRAKIEFLSRMSHEVWKPINDIIDASALAAGALAEDGGSLPDLEAARARLGDIRGFAGQLTDIMNDVLMMTHLSSDDVDLRPCVFDLEDLLRRVGETASVWALEKRQNFRVVFENDFPPAFLGDEGYIERVLRNLLSNASNFTPEGGALTLRVSLHPRPDDTADAVFSVEDTGIGIAEEKKETLFHTFERLDSEIARKYGGTGLGLSISKRLVSLMGGEMGFESELGHGSRFFFRLPLKTVPADTPAARPLLTAGGLAPNLLFVDESADNCRHLEAAARRLGCTSASATDCASALRAIQAAVLSGAPFDAVFADVSVPPLDGAGTAAHIRERFENQPIVMMGYPGQRSAAEPEAAFLPKPVFRPALAACLRETLRNAPDAGPRPITRRSAEFAGKTILAAEDLDISRDILAGLLAHTEVQIIFAENGRDALDAFRAEPERFGMILMDIHMPKMDGLEASRRIRALDTPRAASVPIIAVTADTFPEDIEKNAAFGITGHLAKPIDETALLEIMRNYLCNTEPKTT